MGKGATGVLGNIACSKAYKAPCVLLVQNMIDLEAIHYFEFAEVY